jgi:NAD(P)-dependent dehydrogenase (short-subunit alcohol dehydrogenase family)
MATRLWAARLASESILVYEIRPGVVATDMTSTVTEKYDRLLAAVIAPISRWRQPADVAAAVALLAGGQTPYSTGEVFHVDGGMHLARL